MSPILACFLLLVLTLIGGVLVYTLVVEPYASVINGSSGSVLKYVTDYNSTHVICYVLHGSVNGLVFNGTTWVPGTAYRGDLVIVPRGVAWVYAR